MSVKDRIIQYLNSEGISVTKAEALLGWSKGALLKANSISSDRLGEFILRFDNINLKWLLTGKEPMLKPAPSSSVYQSGTNANYQGTFTEPIHTQIGDVGGDSIIGGIKGDGNAVGAGSSVSSGENGNPEVVELRKEMKRLRDENSMLKQEIEIQRKLNIELHNSLIEEKERMIKILLERK